MAALATWLIAREAGSVPLIFWRVVNMHIVVVCQADVISFQRHWLNKYHKRCLEEVGENVLREAGKTDAYEWVKFRTYPIPETPVYTSAVGTSCLGFGTVMVTVVALFMN